MCIIYQSFLTNCYAVFLALNTLSLPANSSVLCGLHSASYPSSYPTADLLTSITHITGEHLGWCVNCTQLPGFSIYNHFMCERFKIKSTDFSTRQSWAWILALLPAKLRALEKQTLKQHLPQLLTINNSISKNSSTSSKDYAGEMESSMQNA